MLKESEALHPSSSPLQSWGVSKIYTNIYNSENSMPYVLQVKSIKRAREWEHGRRNSDPKGFHTGGKISRIEFRQSKYY